MIKKVYVCDHCSEEMDKPYKTLKVQSGVVFTSDEWHYCEKCWKNVLRYLNEGGELLLFSKCDINPIWTKIHGELSPDAET